MADEEKTDKKQLIHETVSKRLTEAQKSKEFKDTSVVAYTKKYQRSYSVVTVNELDELELDQVNAYKNVEKAKVWQPYDPQEQKDKGYSSGATYIKVKCREALQNRPFDSKDARDVYVKTIARLIPILDAYTSATQTQKALYDFIYDKDFYTGEMPQESSRSWYSTSGGRYVDFKKLDTITGKRFINFCKQQSESAAETYAQAQLYESFSKEQQDEYVLKQLELSANRLESFNQKLSEAVEIAKDEKKLLIELKYLYSGSHLNISKEYEKDKEGFKKLYLERYERSISREIELQKNLNNREGLKDAYIIRNENWGWAFDEKISVERKKSESPKVNTKIPLTHIERIGGLKIPNVSVESITKHFCFNNVVFGNAMKDIESREHVRHFLGALSDLAEILDLDICAVNQLGKLDINFATMGVAGHMATYFPQRKAINLSKRSGDGSIGHEWFHYFDNVIQEGQERKASYRLASESADATDGGVRQSLYQLRQYIHKGDGTEKYITVRFNAQDKVKYHDYGDTLEQSINNIQRMYPMYKRINERNKPTVVNYYGFLAHKYGKEYVDVSMLLNTSMYYYDSGNIGSSYWVETAELFARAFEAYIEFVLDLKGRKNNYLVSYKNNWHFRKAPYPEGEELEKIVLLFDSIFMEFKKEFNIEGFKPFTTEREDEYVEIKEPEKKVKETKPEADIPKHIQSLMDLNNWTKDKAESHHAEILSKIKQSEKDVKFTVTDVTPEGYGIDEPKPDDKQIYLDKIETYRDMLSEETDDEKKVIFAEKIQVYEEMLNEI